MKRKKPDDYFNNGTMEMARFGNKIEAKNLLDEAQHKKMLSCFAEKYDDIKGEIDNLIKEIRELVVGVDPIQLLNFLGTMNYLAMLNKISESEYSLEENMQLRSIEYIQSVMVSNEANPIDYSEEDADKIYHKILDLVKLLYSQLPFFYLTWTSREEVNGTKTKAEQTYIMLSQLKFQVRGTQYQNFRIPVLRQLLEPHSEQIEKIYGISIDELVDGLQQMEHNLSSGRMEAWKKMRSMFEQLLDYDPKEGIPESSFAKAQACMNMALGVDLFDIKKGTGWPDALIEDLSYGLGECDSFCKGEFGGWPIANLPVERRPLIKIDNAAYCFDYYVLFDNFYKALRWAVYKYGEDAVTTWNTIQGHAFEKIVADIFSELLPGSIVNISNFYPLDKKDNAENDILVRYKDVLFIIEAKGGGFTYTPAMLDLEAHKKSLQNLVEKAEKQCLRTKQYIESGNTVSFYKGDDLKEEAFKLSVHDFSQIYMFDVTIADFNEIAAQMEKMEIADAKQDIITVSLNDLWVYKEYFDSPIEFIHFLSQRTRATRVPNMSIMDELDHLGLYIADNMYTLEVEKYGENINTFFDGCRQDLDHYFAYRYMGKDAEKPKQPCPESLKRIIELCEKVEGNDITKFTNFILNYSFEERKKFDSEIKRIAWREREYGRIMPGFFFGENSYVLTVNPSGMELLPKEVQREYVLASIANNNNPYSYLIEIGLDGNDVISSLDITRYCQDDISDEEREYLEKRGAEIFNRHIKAVLKQTHQKKIYPNDLCPCGSGKKYKKCCGR